jgi:hypothetical protein
MKIPVLQLRKSEQGSALIVGLVIATILGVTLASYLVLTQTQNRSMFRSQTWGSSLTLTEAGIEEALAFINKYAGTSTPITNWAAYPSYSNDGWTKSGSVYTKSNTPDSTMGSYTVSINASNISSPKIDAIGTAVWKLSNVSAAQPYYALIGGGGQVVTVQPTNVLVARRVLVQAQNTPIFPVAMAAIGQINLNGNNIATDSFDSGDPNYSVNGKYPTGNLSKTKDNGTIVTRSTLVNSLNVGNADIKGKVKTGPNGTVSIGNQGTVGNKAWVEGGNKGIQPGYSADDFNVDFPNAVLPSVSWSALPSAPNPKPVINGITYGTYILTSGNYQVSGLSGKVYIATNAQVTLYVTGNVSLSGQDQVDISPENASLTIYMGGSSFSTSGNAGLNNLSQNPMALAIYGLPSNTSISLGGNAALSATVYAPQADFSLGGGGNNTYDFVGASITKTVTMNGHYNFHYDENIARVGPSRGYVATSWIEVKR